MLKLYNTMSRKKEEFAARGNEVTMYSCGPTVYSYAHIGNMRAYVFMDSLRRVLAFNGYKLKGMMNITDVGHLLSDADDGEDKMESAAKKSGLSPRQIADFYSEAFFKDLKKLNIDLPEIVEKATDHIDDMLEFVYALVEKGYGYETSDGIYFDIAKFPTYGKLSRMNMEENISGARVEVNPEKHNPADFAIWKKAPKEHIMQWQSRYGMGYPGWHIECSAMSRKYLGDTFDIHTGGVDHIPIHHENEIAQSEALTGKPQADYWMHGEFMQVDGGKMSKSLGNVYTLDELAEKGFSAMHFRFFCLNTHYRKKLNFTFEALQAAKTAYNRLVALLAIHSKGKNKLGEKIQSYENEFLSAINDDINIPLALGVVFSLAKEPFSKEIFEMVARFDKVLGLGLVEAAKKHSTEEKSEEVPQEILLLVQQRMAAKKNRDFALSDKIRDEILAKGYVLIDKKDGYTLTKK